ncbi:MAG: AAA family ATPase, partial [Planctomycetota bacterium]|nr:AAA family ATPase [Planctomycetota bacterium]
PTILEHQKLIRRVIVAPHVQDYAVRLVLATHPQGDLAPPVVNQFLRFGASPRAAQAMVLAGKVKALLDGRANVSIDDIRQMVLPAMRHRILLNFEGEAEGMRTDTILQNIVDTLPVDVGLQMA